MQYITLVSTFQSGDVVDIIFRPNEKRPMRWAVWGVSKRGQDEELRSPSARCEGLFVCFGSANVNS
jgi:hypothetical protein